MELINIMILLVLMKTWIAYHDWKDTRAHEGLFPEKYGNNMLKILLTKCNNLLENVAGMLSKRGPRRKELSTQVAQDKVPFPHLVQSESFAIKKVFIGNYQTILKVVESCRWQIIISAFSFLSKVYCHMLYQLNERRIKFWFKPCFLDSLSNTFSSYIMSG